jgi:SAM-dependent methyltransferase
MEVYKQPLYYEIAFGFFDPREQVDCFERIIKKFSRIEARRFLDLACGPSLQLREIARRGYEAIGLDLSSEMLDYLRKKSKEEGTRIETVQADITSFNLKKKVDFAFIMMGSLNVESNEKFLSHLDSLAVSLNGGGLYFIQNMNVDWKIDESQTWTMKRDGIVVETTFRSYFKDILSQIVVEEMTLKVNDNGERKNFYHKKALKHIFPQEFRTLIDLNGKFEFLGWWDGTENNWFLNRPLEKVKELNNSANMTLLRRK